MGLYSTVFASLACESCGADFRTDVQFYTDDDGGLPQYEVGEVVPVLKPASTYEGIADAFCAPCMERWEADENDARFEALATAVAAGEVPEPWWPVHHARVRELLAKKGWQYAEGTRDLVVLVGSDGRIAVKPIE